jgi:Ubiquitin-2 like Rad60 SUMO-like
MPVKVTELGGDNVRLICMGKGFLMPDTRTLQDCQVPVFKTHPTPINVSIKPTVNSGAEDDKSSKKNKKDGSSDGVGGGVGGSSNSPSVGANGSSAAGSQGCCVIL